LKYAALFLSICYFNVSIALAQPSILVDAQTGEILAQDQAFDRWYPASLTKLMTAYIAFEAIEQGRLNKNSTVTLSQNAVKQPPSRTGFKAGYTLSLDDALKIMLVKSANDIAVAVGETVGGNNYPDLMNETAQKLGMSNSHFVNANGLHKPNHYSSARDLAVLSFTLRTKFPSYAAYFNIEAVEYDTKIHKNYNFLLGRFKGADGMKTGYVCASGFNLVASASQNNRTLIAVVLGTISQRERTDKAADLLTAGFSGAFEPIGMLNTYKPQQSSNLQAVDISKIVCGKQGAKMRQGERPINSKMPFRSRSMYPMEREPVVVKIGTRTQQSTPPVPNPRPSQDIK
jgi:D-alanyl-D-alanine carboxypeptidase